VDKSARLIVRGDGLRVKNDEMLSTTGRNLFQLKEISMKNRRRKITTLSLLILILIQSIIDLGFCYAVDGPPSQTPKKYTCDTKDMITLGYKYGSGTNPYSLVGKCLKLRNIKALQYFDKDVALVEWNYRGQNGLVYLQTPEDQEIFGDSRSIVGFCVGVYSYTTVLGSESKIPHVVVSN
jgi:hypothetical protein